jgi:hypothetical protein
VSCTAGVSSNSEWLRLFPIPYRYLSPDQRFRKYQWVDARVTPAKGDARPESYNVDLDSIKVVGELSSRDRWQARKEVILPLKAHCLCCLEEERAQRGHPTLGIFKPRRIAGLKIERDREDWSPPERARLAQMPLFGSRPPIDLEKIPYRFRYQFSCSESSCRGHDLSCTDWEMSEAYRRWSQTYREAWQEKFREKFERQMLEVNDTHFYVGTVHQHPATWIIVGLFYPKL